jgi:hypothetical protein
MTSLNKVSGIDKVFSDGTASNEPSLVRMDEEGD